MSDVELEAAGLYPCECGRVYESETARMWCCTDDEDQARGIYRASD